MEPVEASLVSIPLPALCANHRQSRPHQKMSSTSYSTGTSQEAIAGEVAAKIGLVRNAILHNRTDGR
jgi:hypothetical protein